MAMRSAIPRKKSNRIEKVDSLIQHLMGGILLPRFKALGGIITITKVQTSRDMRWAKVWISIVGNEDEKVMNTLNNQLYDIQGELNREMSVKIVPRISFHLDTSGRYAAKINEIFKKLDEEKEQEEARPDAEGQENE